ncbi:acyl-CoA thioesterase [Arenimonas fontis]|uniref:Acyl-CoA thioesterase n=1 Tax=Arenimonas fontis TaxID=2608255 RepID=A0A5B2ZFW3_9GAMM|nr:thioesterase family protein [Arenimonas fontis]KAA2285951.1 acyl-CoA thioesterase [Arenimonas fontis]
MKLELYAEIELSPAFHDLDPMDVVWHGNYVRYFEHARCALLQSFGYDYPQMRDSGYAWPVVDMRCKYVRPARYGQRLKVRATLVEWENRLKIDYLIRDADTGEVLTRAHTIQVAVDLRTGEMCLVSPQVLARKLGREA